jgi:hypothetical protein
MRGLDIARLSLLLALCAPGCGPGVGEGFPDTVGASDTDGDTDTDGDSDSDSDVWHDCPPAIEPACAEEQPDLDLLLEAAEIGPDVAFVAMGRNALLATRSGAGVAQPLLVLMDFDEFEGVEALGLAQLPAPPSEPLIAVGVAGDLDAEIFGFTAMALAADSSGYALYGTSVEFAQTGDLEAVPGGAVPTDAELRGLAYLQQKVPQNDPQYELLCAYGDGVYCFDGAQWAVEVPTGQGGPINDVGMLLADERRMLVVGDGGFLARDSGAGWLVLQSGSASDLLAVSVDDELFVAAGRDGALVWGTPSEIHPCAVDGGTVVTLSGVPDEAVAAVYADGPIASFSYGLDEHGPRLCQTGAAVDGALDSRIVGCDSSQNLFVLTAAALNGGSECAVVE